MRLVDIDGYQIGFIAFFDSAQAFFLSHEGGTVELDIECRELSGGRACDKFVITDHGVGMSREFLPQIFEPFEQEKDLTTMDFGGSGVGMAITKRLVELMGGTIEVRSVKGAGTTVTVCLAFERCAEEPAREAARQAQREIPAGTRLLLCEDNHMNTIVARGFLQKMNCVVDCAENGKRALKNLWPPPPDITARSSWTSECR